MEGDDQPLSRGYCVANVDHKMARHHNISRDDVSLNVRDCMQYLTANADMNAILNDAFIVDQWELIEKLAQLGDDGTPVALFAKKEDGK